MARNTLTSISFANFGYITMSLPFVAVVTCLVYSLLYDFHGSTDTHCRVKNILPSISAAIGRTPQRYIWRILISLHTAPRFIIAASYYGWHRQVHVGSKQTTYLFLVKVAVFLHVVENLMLVLLTCVSSNENRDIHENSFILFIITSWAYMLLTIGLCKWARKHASERNRKIDTVSYKQKKIYAAINIISFSLAIYLYFRHNWYCEPYVYSWFGLCEYITVITNILFHGTAIKDFSEYSASFVLTDLLKKR